MNSRTLDDPDTAENEIPPDLGVAREGPLVEIDLRTPREPAEAGVMDVDAIVLGIDDTVYLERDYVRSGFEAVDRWARRELHIEDFGERAWASFEAGHLATIFDEVLQSCGQRANDALITELIARYRTHSPSIALAPDAHAALERWSDRQIGLAVVTDGHVSSQQAKARALELERWASLVVYTAELGHGKAKPHPEAFQRVQTHLEADGKRCVYLAGNPVKDFAGPKSLGWRTIRVRRDEGLHADEVSGDDVDHEVASLDEVDRLLTE